MLLFILFMCSLIFLMNHYYEYFDLIAMKIKSNRLLISVIIFIGTIFLSWMKKKNYFGINNWQNHSKKRPGASILKKTTRRYV
jgi:hypothetical protein